MIQQLHLANLKQFGGVSRSLPSVLFTDICCHCRLNRDENVRLIEVRDKKTFENSSGLHFFYLKFSSALVKTKTRNSCTHYIGNINQFDFGTAF